MSRTDEPAEPERFAAEGPGRREQLFPLDRIAVAVARHAGLEPPAWVLAARVKERATLDGGNLVRYEHRLRRDPGELDALLESLRVNETRFFRHPAQLAALARRLPVGRLRAWSAGCGTGEEAWTLAMLLAEAGRDFELHATDLSETALARAQAGRYPAERIAGMPAARRLRWFVREGGEVSICAELRERVRFERHNLLDRAYPEAEDVILCRNVLIYFSDEHRGEVLAHLSASLAEGGFLLLGSGEICPGLEPVREGHSLLYQRRSPRRQGEGGGGELPGPAPAPAAPPRVFRLTGAYHDGVRLGQELGRALAEGVALVDLDGADYLDDSTARVLGRFAGAAPSGLLVRARRAPLLRWLARHGLDRRLPLEPASPPGATPGEPRAPGPDGPRERRR